MQVSEKGRRRAWVGRERIAVARSIPTAFPTPLYHLQLNWGDLARRPTQRQGAGGYSWQPTAPQQDCEMRVGTWSGTSGRGRLA